MPYTPLNSKGSLGLMTSWTTAFGNSNPYFRNLSRFKHTDLVGGSYATTNPQYNHGWSWTINTMRVSPQGDLIAVIYSNSYLQFYKTDGTAHGGGITMPGAFSTAGVGGHFAEFSPDGSMFAVGTTQGLVVYDTITRVRVAAVPVDARQVNSICWNLAGSKIAVSYITTPYIRVYNTLATPNWVDLAAGQDTSGVNVNVNAQCVSIGGPNDTLVSVVSVASGTSLTMAIWDTVPATWTKTTHQGLNIRAGVITPDGSHMLTFVNTTLAAIALTAAFVAKGAIRLSGTPYALGMTAGDSGSGAGNQPLYVDNPRLYDGRYLTVWSNYSKMIHVYDLLSVNPSKDLAETAALAGQQTVTDAHCVGYMMRTISNAGTTPIVNEDGNPVSGARVNALDRTTGKIIGPPVLTDANGRYSLVVPANAPCMVRIEGLAAGQGSLLIDRVTPA